MRKFMKCRVCAHSTTKYTRQFISIPEDDNLYECLNCGCLNRIGPPPNIYKNGVYRKQEYKFEGEKFSIEIDFWGFNNTIKKGLWLKTHFQKNLKVNKINWVLDIGGYTGFVGYIISKHFKVKCYLDEIDKNGPKIGKILKNDLIINRKPKNGTGLVILSQILEHMNNPSNFLKQKLFNIKDHSYVYIEVPNSTNFPNVDPSHLIDFTKQGMMLIAKNNNLKIVNYWSDGNPISDFRWDNNRRKHCFLFKKVPHFSKINNINLIKKDHSKRKKYAILKNIPFWLKRLYLKQVTYAIFDLFGFSKYLLKILKYIKK